jgi:predicted outer membrane repeat protein
MSTVQRCCAALVAGLGFCVDGNAANISTCDLLHPPTRFVGDTSTDAKCTDNDLQSALNNTSGLTCAALIIVTGEHTYTQQSLSMVNQNVSLIGSNGLCGDPVGTTTVPFRTISGTSGHPVISISGTSNVVLQNLTINDGNFSSGEGGGVFFNGAGSLTLNTDTIAGNRAEYGAGIDMSPSGTSTLTIGPNTYIIDNIASQSGGGIRIEGDTHLIAVSEQTDIGFNTATSGYGGGVEVLGPAYADIGSPGYGFGSGGVINNNTAAYGGGIALFANQDNNSAYVNLFTTVADRPVTIQDNTATVRGGAIFAKPFATSEGTDSATNFCAFNFRIDGNIAPEGAAIYLDYDTSVDSTLVDAGGLAFLNYPSTGEFAYNCKSIPSQIIPTDCSIDTPCNEFSGNRALDAQGDPSDGALIFLTNQSITRADHITIRDNTVAYILHGNGGGDENDGYAVFSVSLIVDNAVSEDPFSLEDTYLELDSCTVAHNAILGSHVFDLNSGSLTLHDTIIGENGPLTVVQSGMSTLSMSNVLSNDISTLPASGTTISGDPMFVDPSSGNYHLSAYLQDGRVNASSAIDFAATIASGGTLPADILNDLDGQPYGQDVPDVPNFHGTRDLGAYEAQPIVDRIFGDALGDRLSLIF